MKIIRESDALKVQLKPYWQGQQTMAFVPTMGNLHPGHLQLIEAAKKWADKVVVSIFVNPTQFGPHEDYDTYPRTFEEDCDALRQIGGVDVVFVPDVTTMYCPGDDIRIHMPSLETVLCGVRRPLFFSGVMTVLAKLLHLIRPSLLVLGEKDFQQLVIVRRLVKLLYLPVEVLGIPTVRELDGLAMSSRNQYLSQRERGLAPELHRQLKRVADKLIAEKHLNLTLTDDAKHCLTEKGFNVDYIEVRYAHDLSVIQPGERLVAPWVVLSAAFLGKVRLIDNSLSSC